MRLIKKNATPKGKAYIYIENEGRIRLNTRLVSVMNLKSEDRISFYQDADNLHDWYIKKDDKGLVLRFYIKNSTSLCCNSFNIAKQIAEPNTFFEKIRIRVSSHRIKGGYYKLLYQTILK